MAKPVFDPTKKFGRIFGISSTYPRGKFEQGGFIFDAKHQCLNPDHKGDTEILDVVQKANEELLRKQTKKLEALTENIILAQQKVKDEGTAASKGALTKLKKEYDKLVAEIESIGE